MEISVIAEREQVEFQALTLHHEFIGNIHNPDFSKVGLPRNRAKGGELRTVEAHPVVIFLVFIVECLQHLWSIVLLIFGLAPKRF